MAVGRHAVGAAGQRGTVMHALRILVVGALCVLPACGPGGEGNSDNAAVQSEEVVWTPGGPDCPIETTGWTVTFLETEGRPRTMIRVVGYVRSTNAGMTASALQLADPVRTTPPTQHFELGPLISNYPVNQADQRLAETGIMPGVTAAVINCNGQEIARVPRSEWKAAP